ncbi:MAG: DUF3050 domain-containing protein [Candidatus Neomarinimicrobiota bacterium]
MHISTNLINNDSFDVDKDLTILRNNLKKHKIYESLNSINDLRIFMENHVFAVWDFMSILKSLQNHLTNVLVPWTPKKNPTVVRFINEIVHSEESDINELNEPKSHFEMYLDAMKQINANRDIIDTFIININSNKSVSKCLNEIDIDDKLRYYLDRHIEIDGDIHGPIAKKMIKIYVEMTKKMDRIHNPQNKTMGYN